MCVRMKLDSVEGDVKMKTRIIYAFVFVMLLVGALAAGCGGIGNNPAPNAAATRTPRLQVPTLVARTAARPTQDTLDDSTNNTDDSTPANGAEPTQDTLDDSSNNGPQVEGGKITLDGTAWVVEKVRQRYQFCDNKNWQLVENGDKVKAKGTFQVAGDTLSLTNGADNKVTPYQMTWNAEERVLQLKQGNTTLTLNYRGKADCIQ